MLHRNPRFGIRPSPDTRRVMEKNRAGARKVPGPGGCCDRPSRTGVLRCAATQLMLGFERISVRVMGNMVPGVATASELGSQLFDGMPNR